MIGTTVPWNAAWSGEDAGWEVRPCRFAQGRYALYQPHKPGVGKPLFAEPHIVRQRRSIAEMRCTVCGERTKPGERYWFGHGNETEGFYMTTESPVHLACATHAKRVCPHLRAGRGEPELFPEGATMLASVLKPESLLSLYGLSSPHLVVGHLKLAWPMSQIRRVRF